MNIVNNKGETVNEHFANKSCCRRAAECLKLLFAAGENFTHVTEEMSKILCDTRLSNQCRDAIRYHLLKLDRHVNLFHRVPRLELPAALVNYLLYDESLEYCDTD